MDIEFYFFMLGLFNSIILIMIFTIRKKRMDIIEKYGWLYLLLAIPSIILIYLTEKLNGTIQYEIFLFIFLAFLFFEWLLDYALKVNFRENFKSNWKWVIPYLCLYYAMNYGFVVMPWAHNLSWGIIMLFLFIIQIVTNLMSHPK